MSRTRFHRSLLSMLNTHGIDGGLKELSAMTGIKYRNLWNKTQNPREMRMYEYFDIVEEVSLTEEEQKELLTAIKEA